MLSRILTKSLICNICLYPLIAVLTFELFFNSAVFSGWLFKSNKDKILGVWETTFDCVYNRSLPGSVFYQCFEYREEKVTLTIHENGAITSGGRKYGVYGFTGGNTIRYWREGREKARYFTIEFKSDDEMIWYTDNKIWKSFRRLKQ